MEKIVCPALKIAGENNLVNHRGAIAAAMVTDRILYPVPIPYVRLVVLHALTFLQCLLAAAICNVRELKIVQIVHWIVVHCLLVGTEFVIRARHRAFARPIVVCHPASRRSVRGLDTPPSIP